MYMYNEHTFRFMHICVHDHVVTWPSMYMIMHSMCTQYVHAYVAHDHVRV